MNMLAQTTGNSNQVTMTSPEIVDFINAYRQAVATTEKPYKELRHDHFMAKVPQVLGEQVAPKFLGTSFYQGNGSAKLERQIYIFPKREACLMAMSYSYELQAQIFDRMTAMEEALKHPKPQLPDYPTALRLYADQLEITARIEKERDYAIATKAEIGSRREATAMATASKHKREAESLKIKLDKSLDFASIKAVEIATGRKFGWHPLKKWSNANKSEIKTIPDPNFGEVKTYHKDAWLAVYNINLSAIRGVAA